MKNKLPVIALVVFLVLVNLGLLVYLFTANKTVSALGSAQISSNQIEYQIKFTYTDAAADSNTALTQGEQAFTELIQELDRYTSVETSYTNSYITPRLTTANGSVEPSEYLFEQAAQITIPAANYSEVIGLLRDNQNIILAEISARSANYQQDYQAALEAALADARSQAQSLAESSGGNLGEITSITEQPTSGTNTRILDGQLLQQVETKASVLVTFELID